MPLFFFFLVAVSKAQESVKEVEDKETDGSEEKALTIPPVKEEVETPELKVETPELKVKKRGYHCPLWLFFWDSL